MANPVSKEEVRHMAFLSMLSVSEEEEELFCRQLGNILAHMEIINKMNTENIAPLYTPVAGTGQTRLDEARNIRDRAEILANAPETDGECFIVPRIV